MKKLSRFFYFSLLLIAISCAPRPVVKAPPVYREGLTLDKILKTVGSDITILKAIGDISITKNGKPYDYVRTSILFKKPDWVHMRVYKLGVLVRDMVIKGDKVFIRSGKSDPRLGQLAGWLYNAVFWWDDMNDGTLSIDDSHYIIRKGGKEILLDKSTLLPVRQKAHLMDHDITLLYSKPIEKNGYWYPSVIKMDMKDFSFILKLKKLIKNPALGEYDFLTGSVAVRKGI